MWLLFVCGGGLAVKELSILFVKYVIRERRPSLNHVFLYQITRFSKEVSMRYALGLK